eukprot:Skav223906  [mRNA]  locus=scaffold5126:62302:79997:- [translate_table: standard]
MPIGRLGRPGLFISRVLCTARARPRAAMATEGKQQSTARRDLLQQIEVDVQKKWEENKVFECNAPDSGSEKFMCTFPYPYMNGLLHIGHAFSLTKAIFAAHFNRLLGKKVLFPFGFHCTGMPIQAAANKLKRESGVLSLSAGQGREEQPMVGQVKDEDFKEVKRVPQPSAEELKAVPRGAPTGAPVLVNFLVRC